MKGLSLFLVLVTTLVGYTQQSKPLQFREEMHDFGNVKEEGGPVTHEFVFTNHSKRPVKILTVQASCGCTTPNWSKEPVPAGKTGFIQASFEPKGRPGHFSKTLTVTTDFDSSPILLQIKGDVLSKEGPSADEFKMANGSWRLKMSSLNMGKVYRKDEFISKEFPILNGGDKPITFERSVSPSYIKADVVPKTLSPGENGVIRISYNGKSKAMYGFQSDNVEFHTNDEETPLKSFSVYASLEDYFPKLSPEELGKAPQLNITNTSLDLGRIQQAQTVTREISFVNNGKKELAINSVQSNCSCVTAIASKDIFKPGEAGSIKIAFNPHDRKGANQKAVTIYSNDPRNPVQRITFSAYVED